MLGSLVSVLFLVRPLTYTCIFFFVHTSKGAYFWISFYVLFCILFGCTLFLLKSVTTEVASHRLDRYGILRYWVDIHMYEIPKQGATRKPEQGLGGRGSWQEEVGNDDALCIICTLSAKTEHSNVRPSQMGRRIAGHGQAWGAALLLLFFHTRVQRKPPIRTAKTRTLNALASKQNKSGKSSTHLV